MLQNGGADGSELRAAVTEGQRKPLPLPFCCFKEQHDKGSERTYQGDFTMLQLENLIEYKPGDEFAEIQDALKVAGELESDARCQLLARSNGDANIAAYVEQLQDASVLREKYVSRLLGMVNGK
jgi:hypothetical protein